MSLPTKSLKSLGMGMWVARELIKQILIQWNGSASWCSCLCVTLSLWTMGGTCASLSGNKNPGYIVKWKELKGGWTQNQMFDIKQ